MKRSLLPGLLLLSLTGSGQQVLQLLDGQQPQAAKAADFSWMTGSWSCEIWGGVAEEYWMTPEAGSMSGMFRFYSGDSLQFLEIFTIEQVRNSVVLRLKHFDADLQGWEEKDESEDFVLVYAEPKRAYFDGMTYLLRDPDHLDVYVTMDHGDGTQEELRFSYTRINN